MPETIRVEPDDEHNRRLVAHVHPPEWTSPEPAPLYDLVVLGGGTAGLVSAAGAAMLGARVALVEKELLGGDCLNVGCVPSKALLRSARAAAAVRRAREYGVVGADGARVDFSAVMERMRRLRAGIAPHDGAERLRALGVDVFFGEGRFVAPDAVAVGDRRLRFRRAVIATGARAAAPAIPGLAEAGYRTNETIFALTELPRRLAVLGAGPIGAEMAQAFARFGAEVTLVERRAQILPREDAEPADRVARALLRDGVRLRLGSRVVRAGREGDEKIVWVERHGTVEALRVDEILVGLGRAPNVESLDLEAAGIEYDRREGVAVNDRLQTTNRRVFAAGDVASRYKFTHAADAMARIVLQNALFFGRAKASALTIPWSTYTEPELAHVGLSVKEARRRGIAIDTFVQELREIDRAVLDGEDDGLVQIHVAKGTDRILGATIVASHAGDLIAEVAVAMEAGLSLNRLARVVHPYPTQAEAIRKVADQYRRSRLRPWLRRALAGWFALGRRLARPRALAPAATAPPAAATKEEVA